MKPVKKLLSAKQALALSAAPLTPREFNAIREMARTQKSSTKTPRERAAEVERLMTRGLGFWSGELFC